MNSILQGLQAAPSTAAYLILCTPRRVFNIEKDHRSATWASSSRFLLTCDHDAAEVSAPANAPETGPARNKDKSHHVLSPSSSEGMERKRDSKWSPEAKAGYHGRSRKLDGRTAAQKRSRTRPGRPVPALSLWRAQGQEHDT